MPDFSKVHGPGAEQTNAEFLRNENTQLKNTIAQLQGETIGRAMPRVAEMIDALNALTRNAAAGSPMHKEVLRQFFATLDAAREAQGRITVVRNGGGPPSQS